MKIIILILLMGVLGCVERKSRFDTMCDTFDSIGAETIFSDAQSLIDDNYTISMATNRYRRTANIYPITNSLVAFGNSATVGSNFVSITTDGLGSWRVGIIFQPIDKDYSSSKALYYYTRNTGSDYTNKYVYPRIKQRED
ncbi:MAG: hypothetical protein PF692_04080 [Kiritimatiellae bacterium]|jgi:hypothetical protein|nr:hypothetical protein [Kiritimatiellia bacterium]